VLLTAALALHGAAAHGAERTDPLEASPLEASPLEASPLEASPLEEVVVVAPYGALLPLDVVPASVRSATLEDIERRHALDVTDLINRSFGGVHVNHGQNNPLQPDVNFRGFTASPLLGLAPGLTVYQNGVRINEPFGDTVSWDLVPLSAVSAVQMLAGAQPVFGLNTLGGALSLSMKNGFDHDRTELAAHGGAFGRRAASLQRGANEGRWGYYANVDYFGEQGWRDYSESDALRFYGAGSYRVADASANLSLALADTELRGNGAAPAELLAIDRSQVFTHPDITQNALTQIILDGAWDATNALRLTGNAFYRQIDTDSFNGDGAFFEACDVEGEELLAEETFTDLNGDDECSSTDDANVELVLDQRGAPIAAELDGAELDAVNNRGRREQAMHGASLQLALRSTPYGRPNDLLLGAAYSDGRTSFDSSLEVASLLENRATSRTGLFAPEFATSVLSEVSTTSVYFVDSLQVVDAVALTIAGRFNATRIRLSDRSGASPELNGSHEYQRFNPSAGITVQIARPVLLYANYGQSARAPTAVELACASEDAPCNLPNAFLADPPLEQVVATSFEVGMRGAVRKELQWSAGVFRTINEDDILFQTTGGAQANLGFFANVGDTRRQGLELGASGEIARIRWDVEYSLIDATFRHAFSVNSPNHPALARDSTTSGMAGASELRVDAGNLIPGIPRHQWNAGADVAIGERLSLGADLTYRSGVYLRGDESNLLARTEPYAIVDLRAEYRLDERTMLFLRIENALDEDYETFGLLGQPDEVFPEFEDPRFYGAGPPFGAWLGVRVRL
jgi:iron complex outermembrane recepter protein